MSSDPASLYPDSSRLRSLQKAIARRESITRAATDCLRLVDAAGDGFGDLTIDSFAEHWLVQAHRETFPDWLKQAEGWRSLYWKKLEEGKASPVWIAGEQHNGSFVAQEKGVHYWIDFGAGYSQGLFIDQRENRAQLRQIANGKRVLNCFAYTCSFGVAAALGGGETTNLDLSRRYLDWGRRNYELNGVDPAAHDFIYGDVPDWLGRFGKKGRKFDVIILDPPTFSRNAEGRVWCVETHFGELARLAWTMLTSDGALFCSTNQRTLDERHFRRMLGAALGTQWQLDFCRMPSDFPGEQYLKACWVRRRG